MSDSLGDIFTRLLKNLPNQVDGDGKTFVAALKKILSQYNDTTENIVTWKERISDLTLTEIDVDSTTANLQVSFSTSGITNYASAQIWVKIGATGTYAQVGNTTGNSYTINSVTNGATYYVKALAVNTTGDVSPIDDAQEASITIAIESIVPGIPTQFILTWDEHGAARWEWVYSGDKYADFFELRLDKNPGTFDSNCLARTRDLHSDAVPTARSGTAYLYVRNVFGTYGTPATHVFSKDQPAKPAIPTFVKVLKGVQISMDALPANCIGYKLVIDDTLVTAATYETTEIPFTLFRTSGTMTVKYCFVDALSDGQYCDTTTVNLDTLIAADDIDDGAVTAEKIAANAVTADKINAGAVTTKKLGAEAVTADKIKAGTITSNELAAGSVIADKIAGGAITTEKLAAADIILSGLLKIVGGGVTLSDAGLKCLLSNGSYALFSSIGLTFCDSNGVSYSSIGRLIIGEASNGQYVRFNSIWDISPSVIISPLVLQTNVTGYNSNSVEVVCRARDISTSGFYVDAYTKLKAGANNSTVLNYKVMDGAATYVRNNTYTGSYSISVPSEATSASGQVSVSLAHGYAYGSYVVLNSTKYWSSETTIGGSVKIYLDGVLQKTNDYAVGSGTYDTISYNLSFSQGSHTIRIDAVITTGSASDGDVEDYVNASGNITATTIQYNVSTDTVIATGTCYFLATDTNNRQYTLE